MNINQMLRFERGCSAYGSQMGRRDWRVDGDTSLDVRLTFNTESRVAYMNVAWHNDDGNTMSLVGDRDIEWDAAMRLIAEDAPDLIMERLKEVK